MNENSATKSGFTQAGPPQAGLAQAGVTEASAIEAGASQDRLTRCGERELGLLRGPRDGVAMRMPPHGGTDAGLGGGLSFDERALLLAAFGIDAHTRPLSLLAVDFIRTRRRLRGARPQTADAAC